MNDHNLLATAHTLARGNPWAYQVWLEDLTDLEVWTLGMQFACDEACRVMANMAEAIARVCEVINQFAQAIFESMLTVVSTLTQLEAFRRVMLYIRLRNWHIPGQLAIWIVRRWPARWLPYPGGVEPGI